MNPGNRINPSFSLLLPRSSLLWWPPTSPSISSCRTAPTSSRSSSTSSGCTAWFSCSSSSTSGTTPTPRARGCLKCCRLRHGHTTPTVSWMETPVMKKTSDASVGSSGGFRVDLMYVDKPLQIRVQPLFVWTMIFFFFICFSTCNSDRQSLNYDQSYI